MFRTSLSCICTKAHSYDRDSCQDSAFPDLSFLFYEVRFQTRNRRSWSAFCRALRQGSVSFNNHGGEPLPGGLGEILAPGTGKDIRRSTSDQNGRFRIEHVPRGTYRFNTTRKGSARLLEQL